MYYLYWIGIGLIAIGVIVLINLSIVIGYLRRLDDSLDILIEREDDEK